MGLIYTLRRAGREGRREFRCSQAGMPRSKPPGCRSRRCRRRTWRSCGPRRSSGSEKRKPASEGSPLASLASKAMPIVLRLRGTKKKYSTAQTTRDEVAGLLCDRRASTRRPGWIARLISRCARSEVGGCTRSLRKVRPRRGVRSTFTAARTSTRSSLGCGRSSPRPRSPPQPALQSRSTRWHRWASPSTSCRRQPISPPKSSLRSALITPRCWATPPVAV